MLEIRCHKSPYAEHNRESLYPNVKHNPKDIRPTFGDSSEKNDRYISQENKLEIWKQIPGLEGIYDVSNFGNVRSWLSENGKGKRLEPYLLTPVLHCGYKRVSLKKKMYSVHVLVLEAFVAPRPGNPRLIHARHLDGDSTNNHVDNLQWGTVSENHADKIRHGTDGNGEKNPAARLSKSQVYEIREKLASYKRGDVNKLAREYGVDQTTISDIKVGRSWTNV